MASRSCFAAILLLVLPYCSFRPSLAGESGPLVGMTAAHNSVRRQLDIPPLVWSDRLAEHARDRARHLAEENCCRLRHETSGRYGENLYWASSIRWSDGRREVQEIDAAHVVAAWSSEQQDFDPQTRTCRKRNSTGCGHYTQIIWRQTMTLGCGMAICNDQGQVWVCVYDPPGNIIGQLPY